MTSTNDAREALYLIRKGGAYYRPNAQGYTLNIAEAGRYTLAEAESYSHPNGPDGPRDDISYMPAPAPASTPAPMTSNPETAGVERKRRLALSDHEAMADAQEGCVPCKLCGGKAIISDAGTGAGYYVRCENSGAFRAAAGCMLTESRLGGWAYNVMDWWNRLHARTRHAPEQAPDDVA